MDLGQTKLRLAAAAERLRRSLWFLPGLMVIGGGALGLALSRAEGAAPALPGIRLLLPSSLEGARAVLQVVAASVITATSVVFSLTVVVLQMAATNYSPRVLRTFLRDVGTHVVLGVFLSTFVYTYIVLQNLRPLERGGEWTAQLAFTAVPVFVVATLAAFVYFIHHVTQAARVETILWEVLEETREAIARVYGDDTERVEAPLEEFVPQEAVRVTATNSGFLQAVAPERLLKELRRHHAKAVLRPAVGDHVLEGTPVAWLWSEDGSLADEAVKRLADQVHHAVQLGEERTMQQDVAFGIRQLVDVAVRALSPGVNDPNTAVATVGHLSVIYADLVRRPLGHRVVADEGAADARLVLPSPSFEEYLHIARQQISHYGKRDAMVVLRLLGMHADLHTLAPVPRKRLIETSARRVLADAEDGLVLEEDLAAARASAGAAAEGKTIPAHFTQAG